LLALLYAAPGQAGEDTTTQEELKQLFTLVEQSNCVFTRNGSDHDSADAADHLRLKSRRGKSYYSTVGQYIDRLATKSSWTGKPYSVQCPGEEPQSSNQWLHGLLDESRGLGE
jgi:hypothetical protein